MSENLNVDEFKDLDGNSISEDHLWEILAEYWEEEFIDGIIDDIREEFNGEYKSWNTWFFENYDTCDGPCHSVDEWWVLKTDLHYFGGLNLCDECYVELSKDEHESLLKEKKEGGREYDIKRIGKED